MSPPVKEDIGADLLCKPFGELYMKTSTISKCCNAIWYHKITTRIFYSIPVEIETYADLILYDFCKLNLPRNGKQKSDDNRSAIYEKSLEEAAEPYKRLWLIIYRERGQSGQCLCLMGHN